MKKYLLSAVLLISICISAKAQFSLGVKGGVDFSKINTNNLNSSSTAGYQVGAFARIGGGLYLQPELYLSSSGGQFNSSNNVYSGNVHFTNLNVRIVAWQKIWCKKFEFQDNGRPGLYLCFKSE